jgi:hypothetical protein
MRDIINLILGRRPYRKHVNLVMTSPEWKKWVAEMCEELGDDVGQKAIAITARHQKFVDAR